MKQLKTNSLSLIITLVLFAAGPLLAAPDVQIYQPTMDVDGRFWVYRNGSAHPHMPFSPYGWMSDTTNLLQLIDVDIESTEHPCTALKSTGAVEKENCIRIKVSWNDAGWAGVAFISGPDKPAWWGETNHGRHYNLGALPKKKLVFYARGEHGGEVIKAQLGVLGEKPFGDSTPKPIASDDLKLTQEWVRHEIDLKDVPPADLARICCGFDVLVERNSQPGSPNETLVYIDDVYYE